MLLSHKGVRLQGVRMLIARIGVRFPVFVLPDMALGGAKFEFELETPNPHYSQLFFKIV